MSREGSRIVDPREIVSIPVPLFQSIRGRYFVGQTENLRVSNQMNAWAGLVNPRNSGVNSYTNVFTISNFSNNYLTAEIWLNTDFPRNSKVSDKVSPTNTTLNPIPQNKVDIRYIRSTNQVPRDGINVYKRIVPPQTTLVSEEDGKFIQGPNQNYTLIIKSSSSNFDRAIVAFGWWEKPKC